MNQREAKAKADHEKVKKDLQNLKRLQDQLRIDQANVSGVSQQEQEDIRKSFREQLQSIGEELKAQFQAAQKNKGEIDVTSVIKSVLQERARQGRIPLPNSDEMESEYELPEPPSSERSGRGSIQRSRTTGSRGSSPPMGNGRQGKDSPGGSSSSSSSSDSDSDRPNQVGDEISKVIHALRKNDSCNQVAKCPEAVFLGKAPKMREPETYEGCHESYILWMKAVKQYMIVRSIHFRDNTTKIYWLGSLLKGEAWNWHQNRFATAEKELQPDTWATYKVAMDYHFRDPHEKRTFTDKIADLNWKGIPGHTKTGLSADQWGIRMAMYQEKAQCDGEVLKEIYM
jgi:hypothetical protein